MAYHSQSNIKIYLKYVNTKCLLTCYNIGHMVQLIFANTDLYIPLSTEVTQRLDWCLEEGHYHDYNKLPFVLQGFSRILKAEVTSKR